MQINLITTKLLTHSRDFIEVPHTNYLLLPKESREPVIDKLIPNKFPEVKVSSSINDANNLMRMKRANLNRVMNSLEGNIEVVDGDVVLLSHDDNAT